MRKQLSIMLMLMVFSSPGWAKSQTITLDVPTMTCALCPITVQKALENVRGVNEATVSYKDKEAIVTFDDAKSNVDELVKATTDAGYPSTIKE